MGAEPIQLPQPAKVVKFDPNAKPLTPKQRKAISLFATGIHHDEICQQIGVCGKTLHNWRNVPLFKAELAKQREAYLSSCLESAKADIKKLGPIALDTLKRAMEGDFGKPQAVRAAEIVSEALGLLKPEEAAPKAKHVVKFTTLDVNRYNGNRNEPKTDG